MEEMTGRTPRMSRRRLTFWAMFGTVGLIMGAAYATGFTSTANTATNTTTGTPTLGTPSGANPNLYGGLVSSPTPLAIGFDGYYGTVPETDMFQIDLTAADGQGHVPLAGETYYADVVIANWTALTAGWDTIDLHFKVMDCTAGVPTDFSTASATHMMNIDRVDAHVTFTGLAGAKKYCIGVDAANATTEAAALAAATGGNVADTVLFRTTTASAPTPPQFAATLNRSA